MATPRHGPHAGAYLTTITVENLRCFAEPQTIDLCTEQGNPARWTLLLGENGTGKTTLLQAMAAASLDPGHLHPDRSDEGYFMPKGFPSRPAPHHAWGYSAGETYVRAKFHAKASREGPLERAVETTFMLRDPGLGLPEGGSSEAYALSSAVLRSTWFGYGPSRRLGAGALTGEPGDPLAGLWSSEAALINAEEWFLQLDYAASNRRLDAATRRQAERTRDRLETLLKAVLPDVTELVPTRPTGTELGRFRLLATTPYGAIPVSDLGLGYQSTLAWVVDLAARMVAAFPESEDPFAEPAVVLVDEIDLHLHPRWQRQLLPELSARFSNVQFIATTHNPLIVQAAPDARVAVLRREGARVVIDQSLPNVRHWRVDQILMSDLFGLPSARDASLDALLTERDRLLAQGTLSRADEARLAVLRGKLGELPEGDTPWEMRAMEVIRRAAASLEPALELGATGVRERAAPYEKAPAPKGAKKKAPTVRKKAPKGRR